MKATEIKCNNYVMLYNNVARIIPNDFVKWSDEKWEMKDFKPIPLTEEWVLKFGFEREGNINWWNMPKESSYKAHHLMEMVNAWTWFIDFDDTGDNTHLVSGFNYVHQLQNLYFALTNTELEIK